MALIVAPADGAESYASVGAADTYHAARGNTSWAALTTPRKEQLLRIATDYMMAAYGGLWIGEILDGNQRLDWPRVGAMVNGWLLDSAAVPLAVANACAELALRAATGNLYVDVDSQQVLSERVGPIAVTYANRSSGQTRFSYVDDMLGRYLRGFHGQTLLVRG